MRIAKLKNQSGVVMLEAIISAGILIFALVTVMGLCSQAFRMLTNIRRMARSSQVLQQEMENIRLMTWTQMQTLTNSFSDPNDTSHIYAGKIYSCDYTNASFGTTSVVKMVTLKVTWTNQTQTVVTNSLTTLIANGGLNKYFF